MNLVCITLLNYCALKQDLYFELKSEPHREDFIYRLKNGPRHRDAGPSLIRVESGAVDLLVWHKQNSFHRVDGPAFCDMKANVFSYYLENELISEATFLKKVKKV